jgi:hypothetical protein
MTHEILPIEIIFELFDRLRLQDILSLCHTHNEMFKFLSNDFIVKYFKNASDDEINILLKKYNNSPKIIKLFVESKQEIIRFPIFLELISSTTNIQIANLIVELVENFGEQIDLVKILQTVRNFKVAKCIIDGLLSRNSIKNNFLSSSVFILDIQDENGRTALHLNPSPEIVRLLLESGANPHIKDKYGMEPIYVNLSQEVFDEFVKHDVFPQIVELNTMMKHGNLSAKAITMFLPHIDFKDGHACPFHYLSYSNEYKELIRLIKSKNIDINLQDEEGNTILHVTLNQEQLNLDLFVLLIENGSDLGIKNNKGLTPIDVLYLNDPFFSANIDFWSEISTFVTKEEEVKEIGGTIVENGTLVEREISLDEFSNALFTSRVTVRGFKDLICNLNLNSKLEDGRTIQQLLISEKIKEKEEMLKIFNEYCKTKKKSYRRIGFRYCKLK